VVFNTGAYTVLPDNSILITANMQSETGFPSIHQLKSYVASKFCLKLAARAVLLADAGLLVPIVDTCLSCEDIARQSCGMVPRWRVLATFLGPTFVASHVQHLSDLHSKFALGPHHVSKYGRHPTCGR